MKRLNRLKENNYVFTTDCENDTTEKIDKITKDIKDQGNKNKNKIGEILKSASSVGIDNNNIDLSSASSDSGKF